MAAYPISRIHSLVLGDEGRKGRPHITSNEGSGWVVYYAVDRFPTTSRFVPGVTFAVFPTERAAHVFAKGKQP